MQLLFIDDEEETRKGIEQYVNWEKLGITQLFTFSNPFDALALAKTQQIDIVLSDIRMPHIDGINLCKQILTINPYASIIFISGYSDKEYLMNAIQMSAIDYIEKPINIPKLEASIKKAVAHQRRTHSIQFEEKHIFQFLAEQLVISLIHGNTPSAETISARFPLNLTDYYRVYIFKAYTDAVNLWTKLQPVFGELSTQKLMCDLIAAPKEDQTVVLIARFASPLDYSSQKIDQLLMQTFRQENLAHIVSCAYGQLLADYHRIPLSYKQAVVTLQKVFFTGQCIL